MTSLADVQGLSNRPATPDCVKWSEDGVVAVAAAHSVVLLNPADLSGPRAFASAGNQCDLSVLQAPGMPADPTADAHHELAHLRQGAMVSQYPLLQLSLQARSLAWSPAGCAATAGCLLATVTNDHQVCAGLPGCRGLGGGARRRRRRQQHRRLPPVSPSASQPCMRAYIKQAACITLHQDACRV